jgi:hypothetical protein
MCEQKISFYVCGRVLLKKKRKKMCARIKHGERPKFLVRPKKGPTMLKSGSSWNLVPLPAFSTTRGRGGVLRLWD